MFVFIGAAKKLGILNIGWNLWLDMFFLAGWISFFGWLDPLPGWLEA